MTAEIKPDCVYFFATCLVDLFYPQAGLAGMALLEREGVKVNPESAFDRAAGVDPWAMGGTINEFDCVCPDGETYTGKRYERAADNEVDDLHRDVYATVQTRIQEDPSETGSLIRYITVSRHLERIADHATNIAEDVLYTVEGKILRHRLK